jgi:coatomer protein complex subunit gamma
MNTRKNTQEDESITQYTTLTKQDVILESQVFNDKVFNAKRCQQVLTKLLYLFDKGEKFTDDEMSGLFFSLTKLVQSEDSSIKHLLYMTIRFMKDTPSFCMITSSITKDVNSNNDRIKANALRMLPLVIESQNPLQLERTLKMSLVNKNSHVCQCALQASCEIIKVMPDVVKKCSEEIHQLLMNNKDHDIQYKAFILIQTLKQGDQVSFIKTLNAMISNSPQYGELTLVYLIRALGSLLGVGGLSSSSGNVIEQKAGSTYIQFLEDCISKESKAVMLEAARILVQIKSLENKRLKNLVHKLTDLLSTEKETYVYSALRVFNDLLKNPLRLALFNNFEEIRNMLGSKNKAVVSMSISILVKISTPENLESLLGQIYDLIDDLPSFVKYEIIDNAILALKKNPKTMTSIMKFLTNCLKDKGDVEFKAVITKAVGLVSDLDDAIRVQTLDFFSEYIEDSQNTDITLSMIDIIGKLLLKVDEPQNYFKYLINRLTLDPPKVRAATITCLGQLGLKNDSLVDDVIMILTPFTNDVQNEEVKARAEYYSAQLHQRLHDMSRQTHQQSNGQDSAVETTDLNFMINPNDVESLLASIEKELANGTYDTSFINFANLKKDTAVDKTFDRSSKKTEDVRSANIKTNDQEPKIQALGSFNNLKKFKPEKNEVERELDRFFASNKECTSFGEVLVSSEYLNLSDPEAEFYVQLKKHFFKDYVSLEFIIQNNSENLIKNMKIDLTFDNDYLSYFNVISQTSIESGAAGKTFINLRKANSFLIASEFEATLNFTAVVMNGSEELNSYQDEFHLENFEIKTSDFVCKFPFEVSLPQFQNSWDDFKNSEPQTQNYQLDFKTIDSAIAALIQIYGMNICGETHLVDTSKNFHVLYLAGLYLNKLPVLVSCQIGFDAQRKCIVVLKARSDIEELSTAFLDI